MLEQNKNLHSVGFEPTSTNTLELESSPLDRSGTNAHLLVTAVDYTQKHSNTSLLLSDISSNRKCLPTLHAMH